MANIFNIQWSNVVENLTPWFWRKTVDSDEAKLLPYLRSMITPVQDISTDLLTLQQNTIEFLNYNGQHKVLEEYLNNTYDVVLRRIYLTENNIGSLDELQIGLTDDTIISKIQIALSGESVTIPVAIGLSNESLQGFNFTVNIPSGIVYDPIVITAQLRNYVEASKNFNFVIF